MPKAQVSAEERSIVELIDAALESTKPISGVRPPEQVAELRKLKVAQLYWGEDMTQEEIAEHLGISQPQVSSYVAKMRPWVEWFLRRRETG